MGVGLPAFGTFDIRGIREDTGRSLKREGTERLLKNHTEKLIKDVNAAFDISNTVIGSDEGAVLQKIAVKEETAKSMYGLAYKATGDLYSVELAYRSGTRSTGTGKTFDDAYNNAQKNSGIASKEDGMSITLQRIYNILKK